MTLELLNQERDWLALIGQSKKQITHVSCLLLELQLVAYFRLPSAHYPVCKCTVECQMKRNLFSMFSNFHTMLQLFDDTSLQNQYLGFTLGHSHQPFVQNFKFSSTGQLLSHFFTFSLACLCWSLHYAKRLLETIFVHRFSHSTMPIRNIFKVND